jgi:hypothetical protein
LRTRDRNGHDGQTRKKVRGLWSALQTHLQGVNRTALAIMIILERHHGAALLSRSRRVRK